MLNALNAVLDVVESAQGLVFVGIAACLLTLAVIYIKNYPHAPQQSVQPAEPEPLHVLKTAQKANSDLHNDLYSEEKSA